MAGTFEECELRFVRAREHFEALMPELDAFLDDHLDRITPEFDAEAGEQRYWVDAKPTPPGFGVIAGDFLHNLRSCLDHISFQMIRFVRANPGRNTNFPIATNADAFAAAFAWETGLKDMHPAFRAVLDRDQPYKALDPEDAPLRRLQRLSNQDKHREPGTALAILRGAGPWDVKHGRTQMPTGRLEGKTCLLALTAREEMKVHPDFMLGVAFEKLGLTETVEDDLRSMLTVVGGILVSAKAAEARVIHDSIG